MQKLMVNLETFSGRLKLLMIYYLFENKPIDFSDEAICNSYTSATEEAILDHINGKKVMFKDQKYSEYVYG